MEVAKVVETFKYFQFWTFTVDHTGIDGREREHFDHLADVRAVSETMRLLADRGWVGRYYKVSEWCADGIVHFHLVVELLKKHKRKRCGYVPWDLVNHYWNRKRNRPEFLGEPGTFEDGRPRPMVGRVFAEEPQGKNGVVAYVCGYISGIAKNPTPEWYIERCDQGHNALLHSPSRGRFAFWPKDRNGKDKPPRVKLRRRRRRRTVQQRLQRCRTDVAVMMRIDHVTEDGELIAHQVQYCGRIAADVAWFEKSRQRYGVESLYVRLSEDHVMRRHGAGAFWISHEGLKKVLEYSGDRASVTLPPEPS